MLTIFSSVLVLYATLASGSMIEKRSLIQTEAMCLSDFSWMDTRQQDTSPCLVAAQLGAICNDGHYDVPALNANGSNKYDTPGANASGTPITFCTCSWAFYNLLSACTVCQNANFTAKLSAYSAFSILCSGRLSETYFPSNLTLPAGVTIPFYATTDPSTWTNDVFNVTAAKQIADTNHADVGAAQVSEVSHKKSSNIGAIVGGVVGGLVAVAIAAAIAFYILRRGRGSPSPISGHESSSSMKQHMRSESDMSGGYTTLSSTPMHYPSSPTILSHTTSVRSQPFQSSIAASTVPYGTASPPPQPIGSPPPARHTGTPPPATVEPYLLAPSNLGDRKKAGPGGFPEFDPVYAPPPNGVRMEISRPTTPERRAVARYNPPEYTERTTGASGSNSRPTMHRGKQESTDTLQSLTSSRNHGTRPTNVHHSPNSSGSGVPNISGQMTSSSNPSYNTSSTPSGHGRQISGSSRDEKRPRAESDSFNPKDLA